MENDLTLPQFIGSPAVPVSTGTADGLVLRTTRCSAATALHGLFICLLIVVSSVNLCSQSASTGALMGGVADPTGAVLPGAQLTLRNTGTGESRTAVADQEGAYRFSLLAPGEYELTVEAVGFAPLVMRGVLIRITEVRSLATQLAVKGVRQDVVVEDREAGE